MIDSEAIVVENLLCAPIPQSMGGINRGSRNAAMVLSKHSSF
jgi:hypothetical protein